MFDQGSCVQDVTAYAYYDDVYGPCVGILKLFMFMKQIHKTRSTNSKVNMIYSTPYMLPHETDVRRACKFSGHQVGISRWSHSTVVSPICLLICDKLDKILHTHWGLGENKMLSTCHLSVTRLQNQIWNAPQKIPRTNYAKWVDHVIDTHGMWCAMFDVSVQHSWKRFDPEWISLGHSWKVGEMEHFSFSESWVYFQ